jgi:hypothetical protein
VANVLGGFLEEPKTQPELPFVFLVINRQPDALRPGDVAV